MVTLLVSLFKTARPRQWLKNFALFTTILFTGQLFNGRLFSLSMWAFVAFCLLSSSNYIFNDVLDAPKDKKHPFKKYRPVASGKVSVPLAISASLALAGGGLWISRSIGPSFFLFAIVFLILQYAYSLFLKHISVIDILTITTAYILRVYAGEAATGYHISIWLALAALSLALFLAIGKRRAELTLIQGYEGMVPKDTRSSLSHYSEKLLDTYTAMFANSTFITYAFFTFLTRPSNEGFLIRNYTDFFADLSGRKWMMVTIPFVLYGIMRYMQLIYEGKGESPEKILTSDLPLLATVILWVGSILVVVYGIGG
ncbi:MAG: Phosphoribose diphosphate:decaprenyl-phosphate phosphoribosyltransferase [Microgenomates group bacterium GW2011_GWA2_47_8]|nr:MAG: Phosphoribose diphosphate:decaprenyl-phosphate phosphoribosyltransferase [Microgenomates group bacterium GW2011_GWA2_47_8]